MLRTWRPWSPVRRWRACKMMRPLWTQPGGSSENETQDNRGVQQARSGMSSKKPNAPFPRDTGARGPSSHSGHEAQAPGCI